ncbi:acyl-CoA thioesterase [Desulfobulbus oligotrophicus]|jgi:acyl-CoA thioester hydrolase|uniref:Acyl-CoA thioesterase n=1 Tax=Desulfobulbus oligotrophicus TaxID=1909699 RepID=A0A7T5VC62_9BACT|nr:thioesterase family protein [Desulfobulbus oligotrophicus]MDY0390096.1 thioesterase family protein [Desulfobulbus oligotrophicus]QQG65202.1 acyl-CoA thioesterase [Desulfobulbus oligotrophicus]
MTKIGRLDVVVEPAVIDANGHVNNVQYVQWIQDAALAHSAQLGWPYERYTSIGRTWIVRSHTIEYYHSAYVGDELTILTWVSSLHKIRSLRKYKFFRPADGSLLAVASTLFIFCDLQTGKPVSIPQEIQAVYTVLDVADEP